MTHTSGALTADAVVVGNGGADEQVGDFYNTPASYTMIGAGATQAMTYQGAPNSTNSGTLGQVNVKGASQTASTSTGYSGSSSGDVFVSGGANASTAAASQGGSVEILPGAGTGGGENGVVIYGQYFKQGSGAHTQWSLQCADSSAAQTADDCTTSSTQVLGVTDQHTGSVVQVHTIPSITPVLAISATNLGDTLCWNPAVNPTEVYDSGSTGVCVTGIALAQVVATSGEWNFADGTSSTITATIPLAYFYRTSKNGPGSLTGSANSWTVNAITNPSGSPSSTGATSGGTVGVSSYNYAQIVAIDGAGNHTTAGAISVAVATITANQTIPWTWTAVTNAAYYQVWACQGSSCVPANYFTSPTNSYTQSTAATTGTGGTLPTTNNTGPLVVQGTIYTDAEHSNSTCTTAKTIDPANGNRQNVTLTAGDTCALTFVQPTSGTVSITLLITQSSSGSFNGTISGGLWPSGSGFTSTAPTISATSGAVALAGCYLNGTNTYCALSQ